MRYRGGKGWKRAFEGYGGGLGYKMQQKKVYAQTTEIGFTASVSLFFKDEGQAERLYRLMQSSPTGKIETRVICEPVENANSNQITGFCGVEAIEIGRNPDGSPWLRYDLAGGKKHV